MKRFFIIATPPLAFALAAMIAVSGGQAEDLRSSKDHRVHKSAIFRETIAVSDDPIVGLGEFEEEFVNFRSPAKERMDAERMEIVLAMERARQGFVACGGGFEDFSLSLRWAEENPAEMFAWLIHEGGSSGRERLSYANMLFENWAATNLPAALKALPRITDDRVRAQALLSTIGVICNSDPGRAKELLVQNLELLSQAPVIYGLGSARKAMCDQLLSLPPGKDRDRLLAQMLKDMTAFSSNSPDEVQGARAIWEQLAPDFRRDLVARGFANSQYADVSLDGLDVLMREKAEETDDPSAPDQFIELQGKAWVKRDLTGALDWTLAHVKGKSRIERGAGLFEYAASQDLDNALRVWQELPEGILKDRAAEALSKGAPAERKQEVEELVRGQPDQKN